MKMNSVLSYNLPDIEDADGDSGNGFQDDHGLTIIREDQIDDALNDIEFILQNQLLGFSETNEESTGVLDRWTDVLGLRPRCRKYSKDLPPRKSTRGL